MKAKLSYKVRKLAKGLLPFYLFTFINRLLRLSGDYATGDYRTR